MPRQTSSEDETGFFPSELVIATTNPGKVREYRSMLSPYFSSVEGTSDRTDLDPVPETGETFHENADLKASGYFEQIGRPTLADDSGLCVEALDGAPGIHSARYAGENASDRDNNRKLLQALSDAPEEQRTAFFECCIVVCLDRNRTLSARGRCHGRILRDPRGDGGFGYDPLFQPEGHERTFGEMDPEEKHERSHRAAAIRNLIDTMNDGVPNVNLTANRDAR